MSSAEAGADSAASARGATRVATRRVSMKAFYRCARVVPPTRRADRLPERLRQSNLLCVPGGSAAWPERAPPIARRSRDADGVVPAQRALVVAAVVLPGRT